MMEVDAGRGAIGNKVTYMVVQQKCLVHAKIISLEEDC